MKKPTISCGMKKNPDNCQVKKTYKMSGNRIADSAFMSQRGLI